MQTHKELNIPESFRVGGQEVSVLLVPYIEGKNYGCMGDCRIGASKIQIADTIGEDRALQSDSSKINTFYHELTHSILLTMGRFDLNEDEVFVSTFGSFLCEAMCSAGVTFDY